MSAIVESNYVYKNMLTKVFVGRNVTIGEGAFSYCYSLQSITIPNSVTSIGQSAFENCTSLHTVIISNSVTSIGICVFNACVSLQNIIIPNSVTSIRNDAFSYCLSLRSITIPSGVTSIGQSAFGCLFSIAKYDFSKHVSIPEISCDTFDSIPSNCKIVVPEDLYDDWIVANNWSTYASNIVKAYTSINYVEATGTQYINTGIQTALDLKIECEYSTTTPNKTLFGARTGSSADCFIFGYFYNNTTSYYANYGGVASLIEGTITNSDGNRHKVVMSNDTFTIDGVSQTINRGQLNNSYDMYLFTWNNNGSADSRRFVGKIYDFKVYKDGTLIQHLVPAKNKQNVVCFYDLVSCDFFYNQGTGDFVYE